jgi:hypothetical protein
VFCLRVDKIRNVLCPGISVLTKPPILFGIQSISRAHWVDDCSYHLWSRCSDVILLKIAAGDLPKRIQS